MNIGDIYEIKEVVSEINTAAALGSGGLAVFGTPYLAAMMEKAAFSYLEEALPDGKSSVGTIVKVNHTSPTPVGMEVFIKVRLTSISENGKLISFEMEAFDEVGPIGSGTHQRAIISTEKFLEKCYFKLHNDITVNTND